MKFFLYISTLLTYAIATPISPDETSKTFKLRSLVLSPSNSSFNNLYLKAYHIYPSHNYAVLAPKTPENLGNVGYLNGTAEDFANKNTDLLFDFSPGTYSFIIDSVNATYNPIFINIGNGTGTAGIFIDQNMIKYHSPISGGFYACNNTLLDGPAVQLFHKPKVISTPERCSDVELVVEYVE